MLEPADQAQAGSFAAPRWTQEGVERTFWYLEVYIVNRHHRAEGLEYVAKFDIYVHGGLHHYVALIMGIYILLFDCNIMDLRPLD